MCIRDSLGTVSLDDLAAEMETNRDQLVCAIVNGDGIDDTIDQFFSEVDSIWGVIPATVIKSLNVRHMIQLLMYGEHGNVDIASELAAAGYDPEDYECCNFADIDITFTFDTGGQNWDILGNASWNAACQSLAHAHGSPDGFLGCDVTTINAVSDVDLIDLDYYRFVAVEFDWSLSVAQDTGFRLYLRDNANSGTLALELTQQTGPTGCPSQHENIDLSVLADDYFRINGDNYILQFANPSGNAAIRIDNVRVALQHLGSSPP
jgi:hypothetical protein